MMVLVHGPAPTITFVIVMPALARPRRGVFYARHDVQTRTELAAHMLTYAHVCISSLGQPTPCLGLARLAISDTNAMLGVLSQSHATKGTVPTGYRYGCMQSGI